MLSDRRRFVTLLMMGVISLVLAGAALLAQFIGPSSANHEFPDVATGSPFHDEVSWLVEEGIATGFPNGNFNPKDPVNRQQAAFWLSNFDDRLPVVMWAQVDHGIPPVLVQGRGATAASRLGPGNYRVTFERSIVGCGLQVTNGDVFGDYENRSVAVEVDVLDDTQAFVDIRDPASGARAEGNFHVLVACPSESAPAE